MQNKLTETLTSFISEITQMERNNAKLNEDIRELEKEKEKGYKSFNTETHILVEKRVLDNLLSNVSDLRHNARYTLEEIDTAERSINDARYNADDVRDSARNIVSDIEDLLAEQAEEEEAGQEEAGQPTFKKPAVKITANKGDYNA
jgi:predicted  nucleic acid-binding Zn-ribbon protein